MLSKRSIINRTASSFRRHARAVFLLFAANFLANCGGGGGQDYGHVRAPQVFNFNGAVDVLIPDSNMLASAQALTLHIDWAGGNLIYNVPATRELTNIPNVEGADYYYSFIYQRNLVKSSAYKNSKPQSITYSWGALSFITDPVSGLSTPFNWDTKLGVEISDASLGLGALSSVDRVYRDIRFADFDNDGLMDAIADTYTEDPNAGTLLLFWGNKQGGFDLDTSFAQQRYTGFGETLVVADLNNDGYLEVFVPQYNHATTNPSFRNLLFTFTSGRNYREVGYEAGLVIAPDPKPEGAQALDWNQDGLIDLYAEGALLINTGNLHFVDIAKSVGLPTQFDEGIKFFDYENDGDLDFVMMAPGEGVKLFINNGGIYSPAPVGVTPTIAQTAFAERFDFSYGLNTGDYNFDGYEDIFVAGGKDANGQYMPPMLFMNYKGVYRRSDIIPSVENGWSDLVSFGDINGDGALDLFYRYGDLVKKDDIPVVARTMMFNPNLPFKTINVDVRLNGLPNQYGRIVKVYYPDGHVKANVVDGGSGYMSIQPYMVFVPNDSGDNLKIEVLCSNRTLTQYASSGTLRFDCK